MSDDSGSRRELRRPVSLVGSSRSNPGHSGSDNSQSASIDQGFQTVEDIEEGIRLLPIEDGGASFDAAKVVALSIHSFCADNANILKELVAFLHEKCLESSSFACRASAVFAALGQFEVAGIKFRDVLLRRIQADFMGREERRIKDHPKFLNAIATLCYVFQRVRLADGATIKILATPVIKYMQLLLEHNRDEDFELFGSQLQILGPELARHEQSQLDELMVIVRQKLSSSDITDLSSSSRTYLVLVLELFLLGWPSKLTDPVEAFYDNFLPKKGRSPPMEATPSRIGGMEENQQQFISSPSSDLFISESPMVESIRQMNLAALAAQMAVLPPQVSPPPRHPANGSPYESPNWSKDLDSVTAWSPKIYNRPPPPIVSTGLLSHNRQALQGSLSLNEYASNNLRPNNIRH